MKRKKFKKKKLKLNKKRTRKKQGYLYAGKEKFIMKLNFLKL